MAKSPGPRPYNDPEYRAAKATLKANPRRCACPGCPRCSTAERCERHADTIDHRPAIVEHDHRRGSGCCLLVPACGPCNYSTGAATGNHARSISRDDELLEAAKRWRG